MITLNLLPDSKLEHLQAVSKQRKISVLCFGAIAAGVALPIILIAVWGGQKALLGIVQGNIDDKVKQVQAVENLEQILTVQNQLHALPGLYDQRLFYTTLLDVLPMLLPTDAHLSSITLDESDQLQLSGNAGSAATVNDFVSILSSALLRESDQTRPAFTSVSPGEIQPNDQGASFSITLSVDGALLQAHLGPDLLLSDRVLKAGTGAQAAESTPAAGTETIPSSSNNNLLPEESTP